MLGLLKANIFGFNSQTARVSTTEIQGPWRPEERGKLREKKQSGDRAAWTNLKYNNPPV